MVDFPLFITLEIIFMESNMLEANPANVRKPRLVLGAVMILALALGLAGCDSAESSRGAAGGGAGAVGRPIAIDSVAQGVEQMKGKVIVLDLWATWCGPCRIEIPSFIKLQQKYQGQGLEIVGVALDPITGRGTTAETVASFMQQNSINYTIWVVNSQSALGKYPAGQGIPTTYVIDRSGRTVKTYVGVQPESVFESDIKSLL